MTSYEAATGGLARAGPGRWSVVVRCAEAVIGLLPSKRAQDRQDAPAARAIAASGGTAGVAKGKRNHSGVSRSPDSPARLSWNRRLAVVSTGSESKGHHFSPRVFFLLLFVLKAQRNMLLVA